MSIDRTSPLKPVSTVQPRETTDAPVTNSRLHQHQCDVKRRASKTDATRQQ
ncbi:anti-sigma-28 factor FlgM [Shigella flexneri]|nr:anti-sigma-28 factor FlgM [Shigella flexneri]SRQ86719.1 anti-sigma-28 factor FlgM [Shigella flexneri]